MGLTIHKIMSAIELHLTHLYKPSKGSFVPFTQIKICHLETFLSRKIAEQQTLINGEYTFCIVQKTILGQ